MKIPIAVTTAFASFLSILFALSRASATETTSEPGFVFNISLSSSDSVQTIAGNYASNFPGSVSMLAGNAYDATVAADEKGKLIALGSVTGVTNADGSVSQLDAKGAMKTQKGNSVAALKGAEKDVFYEGKPVKAKGSTTLQLVETNAQVLKAQGGEQQGTGKTAEKGRGTYAFGKKGATNSEFVNAPTENTAGGRPWSCYFQVYRNEFGHYYATNAGLVYYNYSTNTAEVEPVTTLYAPEWVTYSEKDGSYSVNFYKPTSGDLNAKWSVKKLVPIPTTNPTGTINYKFLGQKGSGAVSDFSPLISTNAFPRPL